MAKKKPTESAKTGSKDVNEGIGCAILSYLLIGIIWFFVDDKMRKNNYAKFHVKQALILLLAWVVVWVALAILGLIMGWIPVAGGVVMWILRIVFGLILFIIWLIGILAAATSKEKELPVIGTYADRFTF